MIKSFKERLHDDLAIFINLDEWGELHVVEGKEVPCVLTTDQDGTNGTEKDVHNVGLIQGDLTLYVKQEDCNFKYSAGKHLNIDGREHLIEKADTEGGLLVFHLSRYRRN